MAGYSYTVIIGHVGGDPEMRYLQNGTAVCSFSVAVSRKWSDKTTNEAKEETTWFRVSAWRALGETCNQYVKKGMQIMVAGRVSASAFTAQDGTPRASLEMNAQDVTFLGSKGDSAPTGEASDLPF